MNPTDKLAAADQARACALLIHFLTRDRDGLTAIVNEAVDAERAPELLLAVLAMTATVQPALYKPEVIETFRSVLARFRADAAGAAQ